MKKLGLVQLPHQLPHQLPLIVEGAGCTDTEAKANYINVESEVSPIEQICEILFSLSDRPDAIETKTASVLRNFRDNVLAPNFTGKVLITLYYYHSKEIIEILDKNPELKKIVGNLVEELTPKVNQLLNSQQTTLTNTELSKIKSILNEIADNGSTELGWSIDFILKQIDENNLLHEYGINILGD